MTGFPTLRQALREEHHEYRIDDIDTGPSMQVYSNPFEMDQADYSRIVTVDLVAEFVTRYHFKEGGKAKEHEGAREHAIRELHRALYANQYDLAMKAIRAIYKGDRSAALEILDKLRRSMEGYE